ncbi:MAG TPA: DUF481 domain-containing protein [Terriglobales bacterium]|nr:DUF481 domain-containing protein [Terriglobales bacterium]
MSSKSLLAVALICLPSLAAADQVVLKNGDRLTGSIVKLDDNKLTLKTDFADAVAIKWEAISKVAAEKPLYVQTSDQQKLSVSSLSRQDSEIVLDTSDHREVHVPAANLAALRSQSEQQVYEKSLHPGLMEGWVGGANFGLALARGNSATTNLAIGANMDRKTRNDKISLYEASVYNKDNITDTVSANTIRGGIRYERNITKKVFGYVSGDFESNDLQKLDIRSIIGGGLGYHLIAAPKTTFDILGGMAWTHEKYGTGISNNYATASIGQEWTQKLSDRTSFNERAYIFPYLSGSTGDYRFAFDAGFTTKISRIFAWQITASDRYVSNPLPGTKGNDLLLTTGLAITLAGGGK